MSFDNQQSVDPEQFEFDVFVSFNSGDATVLRPIVQELRSRDLKVWWSEDLLEGRWDRQIAQKLNGSRRILGFISDNAQRSDKDYIIEELDLARRSQKLIPIIVGGNGVESFAYRGLINLLQSYYFDDYQAILASPNFEKLVHTCGGQSAYVEGTVASDTRPEDRVETWFSGIERNFELSGQISAFSLSLSAAILENGPLTEVELLSTELRDRLIAAECAEETGAVSTFPIRTSKALQLIECEMSTRPHPALGIEQTLIRFRDAQRAFSILEFAWTEFGGRRAVLQDWWTWFAQNASRDGQMRLGSALGALAQKDFMGMFDAVFSRWIKSDSDACFATADIALSVSAFDATCGAALEKIIYEWLERGSEAERVAAVRLACGFAGARIPGLVVGAMRRAVRSKNGFVSDRLLVIMGESLQQVLRDHAKNADNSLYDLHGLIRDLADWVSGTATGSSAKKEKTADNAIPIRLFLFVLDGLPLVQNRRIRGRLSLDSLVENPETAIATSTVFNLALSRHAIGGIETRRPAIDALKTWIHRQSKSKTPENDPLKKLAQHLVSSAQTSDDEGRITFLFAGLYSPNELRGAVVAPVLGTSANE